MQQPRKISALAILSLIFFVSACGGGETKPADQTPPAAPKPAANNQPATVKIAVHAGLLNDNDLKRYFIDPVKQKFPHITIERINVADKGSSLNELVASNATPDMVINYPYNLTDLTKLGIEDQSGIFGVDQGCKRIQLLYRLADEQQYVRPLLQQGYIR
ncbi:MAG: hypothetical protein K0R28_6960 [Paenibacillus sp.]|nr:hypothetical protein [Paenibacillus sp.]